MAGQIKRMIDDIIARKSGGNQLLMTTTRVKLLLKGIDTEIYNERSSDDPVVLKRLKQVAVEFGVDP